MPTQTLQPDTTPLVAFGAHPDDIEFGCGGILAAESRAGRKVHMVVCSRGEAASNGTPHQRMKESQKAAKFLGASLEFVELDGDAHLQVLPAHAIKLAKILRTLRPGVVLAPTLTENQHPDHPRLGQLVREAARLARYGGVAELKQLQSHAIGQLFFYAISPDGEPKTETPVLVGVADKKVLSAWTKAMRSHASQLKSRQYIELQLARAQVNGLRAGMSHAIAIYPNEPIVLDRLSRLGKGARKF
jgi:LmbE family N-acetylglucosaminyl deacetylase